MALSNFDTRIIKVVQVTHHQNYIRYGVSQGIQCSYMSLKGTIKPYYCLLKDQFFNQKKQLLNNIKYH